MKTSKELFQSSPAFKDFQAMRSSPAFEAACNAAILGLIESLPISGDPSKSWDGLCQVNGARKAFEILSNLHVPESQERPAQPPTPYDKITNPKHRP